ncbi:MAG: M48 family peptidase [Bryobacteraceae bacterium]
MQVETALFFETVEQIYTRVFSLINPRSRVPPIVVRFRKYANANSRIKLQEGHLTVSISDVLEGAPAPIQEALAHVLLSKLICKTPSLSMLARYRRYLNRGDVRQKLHLLKQKRGRKVLRNPIGKTYDLDEIFEELNLRYFHGLMARPTLGWSPTCSRSTLGYYDPCHNVIVVSRLFDSEKASRLIVRFILFHEMLHLKYPAEHKAGRRCVHTKEFKEAEMAFEGYRHAKAALKEFLESPALAGQDHSVLQAV